MGERPGNHSWPRKCSVSLKNIHINTCRILPIIIILKGKSRMAQKTRKQNCSQNVNCATQWSKFVINDYQRRPKMAPQTTKPCCVSLGHAIVKADSERCPVRPPPSLCWSSGHSRKLASSLPKHPQSAQFEIY